jgi:hypothetical protein
MPVGLRARLGAPERLVEPAVLRVALLRVVRVGVFAIQALRHERLF